MNDVNYLLNNGVDVEKSLELLEILKHIMLAFKTL